MSDNLCEIMIMWLDQQSRLVFTLVCLGGIVVLLGMLYGLLWMARDLFRLIIESESSGHIRFPKASRKNPFLSRLDPSKEKKHEDK